MNEAQLLQFISEKRLEAKKEAFDDIEKQLKSFGFNGDYHFWKKFADIRNKHLTNNSKCKHKNISAKGGFSACIDCGEEITNNSNKTNKESEKHD